MAQKLKRTRGSDNIFADLGFPPAEAENLKMRSELMIAVETFYRRSGLTQAQAAKRLGVTQPRLNALLKGKIELFSVDALVNIAKRAGLDVRLVIRNGLKRRIPSQQTDEQHRRYLEEARRLSKTDPERRATTARGSSSSPS